MFGANGRHLNNPSVYELDAIIFREYPRVDHAVVFVDREASSCRCGNRWKGDYRRW